MLASAMVVTERDWYEDRPWVDDPSADIDAYVRQEPAHLRDELRSKLLEWRRDGIVVFERGADPELIDEFMADVEYLIEHPTDFELSVERWGTQRPIREFSPADLRGDGIKLNVIHSISLAATRLSLSSAAISFLAHVFREEPVVLQSLTFLRGSQQPVHLDYPYVRCQTRISQLAASWIAMEDVQEDSGPLAYFPGSHKVDMLGFYDWGGGSILLEPDSKRTPSEFAEHLYARLAELGIERRVFVPKKGDILIWHGALAHEGMAVRRPDATRRSYVTHYTSLRSYPAAHAKPEALETRAYVSEHGGYSFEYPWLESDRRLPSWQRVTPQP
jgi:phytanoyl-CoA hydroxylase